MADYLIRGKNVKDNDPHYRGTYRFAPDYYKAASDDHEVNRAFFWYLDERGEAGVVHDLPRALDLVRVYRSVGQVFEVVEVKEDAVEVQLENSKEFWG